MDLKEIREMEAEKLQARLAELKDKVRELRFGVANRQVKNVREIRTKKTEIARISTILTQRRATEK